MVLAQAAEPSMFGWYLGFAIGGAVVVVVVLVVGTIIFYAERIGRQAEMAAEAISEAYRNTLPLWEVADTNRSAHGILEDARTARDVLEA